MIVDGVPERLDRQVARARRRGMWLALAGATAVAAVTGRLAERGLLAAGVAPQVADWAAVAVGGAAGGGVMLRALRRAPSRVPAA